MTLTNPSVEAQRLLNALDLMDFGVQLMRQNIARALPTASSEVVESELARWLWEQPTIFIPRDNYSNE